MAIGTVLIGVPIALSGAQTPPIRSVDEQVLREYAGGTRGSNAEMASLQRFVPGYSAAVRSWLAERVNGFD